MENNEIVKKKRTRRYSLKKKFNNPLYKQILEMGFTFDVIGGKTKSRLVLIYEGERACEAEFMNNRATNQAVLKLLPHTFLNTYKSDAMEILATTGREYLETKYLDKLKSKKRFLSLRKAYNNAISDEANNI